MSDLQEDELQLLIQIFPSGTRDFIFCTFADEESSFIEIVHPMDLLGLDLAAMILDRINRNQPAFSLVCALCRLLVPCLEYRGNRRHLVVEEWSEDDIRGETLHEDTRTTLALELAAEQAIDFRMVTSGEKPPDNSLPEIFWDAHTELPDLPDVFSDCEMSDFAKCLYQYLVPPGEGLQRVRTSEIRRRVMSLWTENFESLAISTNVRERRRVFKRILAATVRLASQLNGIVAKALVFKRLNAPHDEQTLTSAEESLLELRYGGSRALRDINIGLLFGCGPMFAELINSFAFAHVADVSPGEVNTQTELLRAYIFLLGQFRHRRKMARAAEKRDARLSRQDKLPGGSREAARYHADKRAIDPKEQAESDEEWKVLASIMPYLKPRDAKRLQSFIHAGGDRGRAGKALGVDRETFNRWWRQTTLPNIQKAIKRVAAIEGFGVLLGETTNDGEKEDKD